MISVKDENILFLDSKPGYEHRVLKDMKKNSVEYDGRIVYIKQIHGEPIEPFVKEKTFYFNSNGEWYTLGELNSVR